jgi:hypothetical protein
LVQTGLHSPEGVGDGAFRDVFTPNKTTMLFVMWLDCCQICGASEEDYECRDWKNDYICSYAVVSGNIKNSR